MATSFLLPRAFLRRRVHSLMGLGFFLFLTEHLLTNSKAAVLLGEEGRGFIDAVNAIHRLPYLHLIEWLLIGMPILIHVVCGIRYARMAKCNSGRSDGSTPSIPTLRNRAYTWQKWTAWFLILALGVHVTVLRFVRHPQEIHWKKQTYYAAKISSDALLPSLARQFDVLLYDAHWESSGFLDRLDVASLGSHEVFAVAHDFGTASLLTVRDTFKSVWWRGFYTLFVLAASFHAGNGLWTCLITWGLVIKIGAQRTWGKISLGLMILLFAMGLLAIWG